MNVGEDQIDKFYLYFEDKCPEYMRHKFMEEKCVKCNMVSNKSDPSWRYSDAGLSYYSNYYTLFLISKSKKKIMSILNKITNDSYDTLSHKFIDIITSDIMYIEQADDVIDQLLKKIINDEYLMLYARLCKMIMDKNEKYIDSKNPLHKKYTFQVLLIKKLQAKYCKLIKHKDYKREIILLLTFICRLFSVNVVPALIISHIIDSLFATVHEASDLVDYYVEIICRLLFDLSNYDQIIKHYITKISLIRKDRESKDRVYMLILNLEEEYSKQFKRKERNEKKKTLTTQNKRQIQIQKENQKNRKENYHQQSNRKVYARNRS